MFGGGGGNVDLMLLRRNDVRKELVLIPDQVKQLESVAGDMNIRDMMSQYNDLPMEERMAKIRAAVEDVQKKMQQKIDDILLPHQATRLKQLAFQYQMDRLGGVMGRNVAEELNITDEQRTQLVEKAQKLQQELQKKMQQELIKDLTPAQQAKLKELAGEPFQFDPNEQPVGGRGRAGGMGGARGGPGAAGPGQRGGGGGRRGGNRGN